MEKEKFVKMAKNVHGSKYDYSLLPDVFKMTDRVPIICAVHGEFMQIARNHVHAKQGCPVCGRLKANEKMTDSFEEFLEKEKRVHGDKYEPIRESFTATKNKLKIRCKKCGKVFEQTGVMHLAGNGCSFCNPPHKKLTTEEFKERLAKTHPNLEVLSEYISTNKPITVRCKIHDHTYTTTPHRLVQGANCQKCYDEKRGNAIRKPVDKVLEDLRAVHGDKYEYPYIQEEYKNNKVDITVVCKNGHITKASVNQLLSGHGCGKCADIENGINKRLTADEFIIRSNKKHNGKYNYPNINEEYSGYNSKVTVVCPVHGEFKQNAGIHLSGCGCPSCNESHLEHEMSLLIPYAERWKRFDWLGQQSLDFYLPDKNIAIECQGVQHFKPLKAFGGESAFSDCVKRDIRKNRLCKENGVKLIYVINKEDTHLINDNDTLYLLYNDNTYFIEDITEGKIDINELIG